MLNSLYTLQSEMLIKDVVYRNSIRLLNWKSLLNSTTVDGAVDLMIQLSVEVGLVALISSVVLMPPQGIRVIWAPPFVVGALTRPVASCCPHRRTSCCGTRWIPGSTCSWGIEYALLKKLTLLLPSRTSCWPLFTDNEDRIICPLLVVKWPSV